MHMHICKARNQILPAAVDLLRFIRYLYFLSRPERGDAVSLDENRLVLEYLLPVHGDDGNIDEGGDGIRRGSDADVRKSHQRRGEQGKTAHYTRSFKSGSQ